MLKIQEALDLIIEHYIDKLKEVRRGEGHTIPDRYALTILEDTEAIRNYVKPVLADRIRELDEQVPKIRIEDLTGEIEGKEWKTSSVWHTGKPTEGGLFLVYLKDGTYDIYEFGKEYKAWHIGFKGVVAWMPIEPYKEK